MKEIEYFFQYFFLVFATLVIGREFIHIYEMYFRLLEYEYDIIDGRTSIERGESEDL